MSYAPGAPPQVWALTGIDDGAKFTLAWLWSRADHEVQRDPRPTEVRVAARFDEDGKRLAPGLSLVLTIQERVHPTKSLRTIRGHLTRLRKLGLADAHGRFVDLTPPVLATDGQDVPSVAGDNLPMTGHEQPPTGHNSPHDGHNSPVQLSPPVPATPPTPGEGDAPAPATHESEKPAHDTIQLDQPQPRDPQVAGPAAGQGGEAAPARGGPDAGAGRVGSRVHGSVTGVSPVGETPEARLARLRAANHRDFKPANLSPELWQVIEACGFEANARCATWCTRMVEAMGPKGYRVPPADQAAWLQRVLEAYELDPQGRPRADALWDYAGRKWLASVVKPKNQGNMSGGLVPVTTAVTDRYVTRAEAIELRDAKLAAQQGAP